MQIFVKNDKFDIFSKLQSMFTKENKDYGPECGYEYNTFRSVIKKDGLEWLSLIVCKWDSPEESDVISHKYYIHIDIKRIWEKLHIVSGGGIDFVFEEKEKAQKVLDIFLKDIDNISK